MRKKKKKKEKGENKMTQREIVIVIYSLHST